MNLKLFFFLTAWIMLMNCRAQAVVPKLSIQHLTGNYYVYTSYKTYGDTDKVSIPANGMYVLTDSGAILIDSPFDTTQFQPLLDSIWIRHGKRAVMCIATHSHDDRTAGLEYYRNKGIRTYTTFQTDEISRKRGEKRAEFLIFHDTTFRIGNLKFDTWYAGEGHAPDNIVLWFADIRLLYGGCLVKSTDARDLGNLHDASVEKWPVTIKKILKRYGQPDYVIPGHFSWDNKNSLQHTLRLIAKHRKKSRSKR